MTSLKWRLFLQLAMVTFLVWGAAVAWTTYSTHTRIERALDNRLQEAASMVASLGTTGRDSAGDAPAPISLGDDLNRQLSCQIWSISGKLISRSDQAPTGALASPGTQGFSNRLVDGKEWRVYSLLVPQTGLRVMVGDTMTMRRSLLTHLIAGLLVPAIIGIAALALLIWITIGKGMVPLERIAAQLSNRKAGDLSPLKIDQVPSEIEVMTGAIDTAFARLGVVRDKERRFLASAAHEMQTPLAGLKTHADIAKRTEDPELRKKALSHIESSVNRTTRLVQQLLECTWQDASDVIAPSAATKLGPVVEAILRDLANLRDRYETNIVLDSDLGNEEVALPEDVTYIVLKNLIENAILYGPKAGTVRVGMAGRSLFVEDDGKGIAEGEVTKLRGHFTRGRTDVSGSGLGLAIVDSALQRADAMLEFSRDKRGRFRVKITTQALLTD